MKRLSILAISTTILFSSCGNLPKETKEEMSKETKEAKVDSNPFFTEYNTPHQTPPFELIKNEHFMPAFNKGIQEQNKEIEAIINNPEAPTFENTVEALEFSGKQLSKVSNVFFNLTSAHGDEEIQGLKSEALKLIIPHSNKISMNAKLFERVKAVYDKRDELGLKPNQIVLLEKQYKGFVRGGALLNDEKKAELSKIKEQLSEFGTKFGNNILKETKSWKLVIDNKKDLSGLPKGAIAAAAAAAKANKLEGKWVFTLDKPSMIPFLQYADNRELRKEILTAYSKRGDNDNEFDNKELINKIANLRVKEAHLLGYDSHADYILEERMLNKPEKVYDLLNNIWEKALPAAKEELKDLQAMSDKEGNTFKIKPWDWWYYAEKVKKAKYDLDEEMLRPYFMIDNVRDGAFAVASKLYGLKFVPRDDISTYHKDVQVIELQEADGTHIGIFYLDYFPRSTKRGGAYMNSYRKQSRPDGVNNITPIVCNVCNFTAPVGDTPSLLSVDEVQTLFHEFGHALHGFLSNCQYNSLSGTSVPRDFVELPSQIMENWALEPEVLKMYAKHYETGELIPDELIEKVQKAGKFNQGFITVEFTAAALLDMDYHTLTEEKPDLNATTFENASMKKMGMLPEIIVRYRSTYFNHIFPNGGYSSGYYAYTNSAVLDADAFKAFTETGDLFNPKVAKSFRENVLSRGGSQDPAKLYRKFRGTDPTVDALMERKGFQ
ncbi:MAG: M3 family metallopeptidase [Hyphomicrobiales bacterium]